MRRKNKTANAQLKGVAKADEISKWKEEHKLGIYHVVINGHVAYFRNPGVDDLNIAASTLSKDTPLDYFDTIAEETYLGGSKEVWEKEENFQDFVETIKPKLEGTKGELQDL